MPAPRKEIPIGSANFRVWVLARFDDEITTYQLREQRNSRDNMVNILIGEALAARRLDAAERLDKAHRPQKSSTCPQTRKTPKARK